MKKAIYFISFLAMSLSIHGQENAEPNWGIKFSGFVKTDLFWDTRQVVAAREGHFLLWPAPPNYDVNGEDINAHPSFNFMNIQTRIRGTITGPDVLGAKSSGVVEGAFFGHNNLDVNGFRMRHAFVKLNWSSTELIVGQTWHPMFIAQSFPLVISFNTGAPFQPFARNPQVRLTQRFGNFSLAGIAFSHRDFTSAVGVDGLRNSAIPELHLQMAYQSKNESSEFLVGGWCRLQNPGAQVGNRK